MNDLYSLRLGCLVRTMREEGWAFILVCLYLLLEYVRPQSIYTSISDLPLVPLVLFLCIGAGVMQGEFGKSSPQPNNKLIVLYAVVVVLSIWASELPAVSQYRYRMFFDWFVIYFLIVNIVTNERRLYIFILAFLLFSFKMSQHGALSWMRRGFAYASWGVVGAPGWFHNSGEVGIQMCIFVPLAISFIVASYRHLSRMWFVGLLLMPVTGIATVVASSSRGALVGLGVAGLWSIKRRPSLLLKGGLALALCALVVYKTIPEESLKRLRNTGQDSTSAHRMEKWRQGLETMNRFPVFGLGFAAWDQYYPRHYSTEHDNITILVHNVFVQCGSELGYTGLAVFVAMILACFSTTRRVRRLAEGHEDAFLSTLSYGFDCALVGFLGSAFFVTVLYYPYFWIHCAMTACLYTAASRKYVPGTVPL